MSNTSTKMKRGTKFKSSSQFKRLISESVTLSETPKIFTSLVINYTAQSSTIHLVVILILNLLSICSITPSTYLSGPLIMNTNAQVLPTPINASDNIGQLESMLNTRYSRNQSFARFADLHSIDRTIRTKELHPRSTSRFDIPAKSVNNQSARASKQLSKLLSRPRSLLSTFVPHTSTRQLILKRPNNLMTKNLKRIHEKLHNTKFSLIANNHQLPQVKSMISNKYPLPPVQTFNEYSPPYPLKSGLSQMAQTISSSSSGQNHINHNGQSPTNVPRQIVIVHKLPPPFSAQDYSTEQQDPASELSEEESDDSGIESADEEDTERGLDHFDQLIKNEFETRINLNEQIIGEQRKNQHLSGNSSFILLTPTTTLPSITTSEPPTNSPAASSSLETPQLDRFRVETQSPTFNFVPIYSTSSPQIQPPENQSVSMSANHFSQIKNSHSRNNYDPEILESSHFNRAFSFPLQMKDFILQNNLHLPTVSPGIRKFQLEQHHRKIPSSQVIMPQMQSFLPSGLETIAQAKLNNSLHNKQYEPSTSDNKSELQVSELSSFQQAHSSPHLFTRQSGQLSSLLKPITSQETSNAQHKSVVTFLAPSIAPRQKASASAELPSTQSHQQFYLQEKQPAEAISESSHLAPISMLAFANSNAKKHSLSSKHEPNFEQLSSPLTSLSSSEQSDRKLMINEQVSGGPTSVLSETLRRLRETKAKIKQLQAELNATDPNLLLLTTTDSNRSLVSYDDDLKKKDDSLLSSLTLPLTNSSQQGDWFRLWSPSLPKTNSSSVFLKSGDSMNLPFGMYYNGPLTAPARLVASAFGRAAHNALLNRPDVDSRWSAPGLLNPPELMTISQPSSAPILLSSVMTVASDDVLAGAQTTPTPITPSTSRPFSWPLKDFKEVANETETKVQLTQSHKQTQALQMIRVGQDFHQQTGVEQQMAGNNGKSQQKPLTMLDRANHLDGLSTSRPLLSESFDNSNQNKRPTDRFSLPDHANWSVQQSERAVQHQSQHQWDEKRNKSEQQTNVSPPTASSSDLGKKELRLQQRQHQPSDSTALVGGLSSRKADANLQVSGGRGAVVLLAGRVENQDKLRKQLNGSIELPADGENSDRRSAAESAETGGFIGRLVSRLLTGFSNQTDSDSLLAPNSVEVGSKLTTEKILHILIYFSCSLAIICLVVIFATVRCQTRRLKSASKQTLMSSQLESMAAPLGPLDWRRFAVGSDLRHNLNHNKLILDGTMRNVSLLARHHQLAGKSEPRGPARLPAAKFTKTCCHCVTCSESWLFRDSAADKRAKSGPSLCHSGYYHPAPRGKLPFGAASSVNKFLSQFNRGQAEQQQHSNFEPSPEDAAQPESEQKVPCGRGPIGGTRLRMMSAIDERISPSFAALPMTDLCCGGGDSDTGTTNFQCSCEHFDEREKQPICHPDYSQNLEELIGRGCQMSKSHQHHFHLNHSDTDKLMEVDKSKASSKQNGTHFELDGARNNKRCNCDKNNNSSICTDSGKSEQESDCSREENSLDEDEDEKVACAASANCRAQFDSIRLVSQHATSAKNIANCENNASGLFKLRVKKASRQKDSRKDSDEVDAVDTTSAKAVQFSSNSNSNSSESFNLNDQIVNSDNRSKLASLNQRTNLETFNLYPRTRVRCEEPGEAEQALERQFAADDEGETDRGDDSGCCPHDDSVGSDVRTQSEQRLKEQAKLTIFTGPLSLAATIQRKLKQTVIGSGERHKHAPTPVRLSPDRIIKHL